MNIIFFVFTLIIVAKLSYDTGYKKASGDRLQATFPSARIENGVEYPAKMSVDLKPTPTTLDDNK